MAKDTFLNRKTTLKVKGKLLDLSRPCAMGILNLTADSFYKNNRFSSVEQALLRAETIIEEGGKIIDIGAYSSRPGATDVTEQEERDRIIPVIEAVCKAFPDTLLSVDTFRANVARAAVNAGAHMINDISAGEMDEAMFQTIAELKVPYIIMHMKGTPKTMQQHTTYQNIMLEIIEYFDDKISRLAALGVTDIVLDPGFGFAKTLDQNYEVLKQMESLKIFELPVLAGLSRKSMIYKVLGGGPEQALDGTITLNTIALLNGASILRVHDVKAATASITLVGKLNGH